MAGCRPAPAEPVYSAVDFVADLEQADSAVAPERAALACLAREQAAGYCSASLALALALASALPAADLEQAAAVYWVREQAARYCWASLMLVAGLEWAAQAVSAADGAAEACRDDSSSCRRSQGGSGSLPAAPGKRVLEGDSGCIGRPRGSGYR
jgi:hypothetical protein